MITAPNALQLLQDGNRRFVAGESTRTPQLTAARRQEIAQAQRPFAIILSCADSRVPPELIFDQDLGDLFVVRVAGNIIEPSQLGSVEFAAEHFGSRLVIVLGHSRCGAITAALQATEKTSSGESPHLRSIVDRIRKSIDSLLEAERTTAQETLLERAVRANVSAAVHQMQRESSVLQQLIRKDGLLVTGAEYSLDTGQVDFFEGVPR